MSTKEKTEKTAVEETEAVTSTDTEQTPETVENGNKKVFGPLGKYAVIAVLMVSIIVTTAIMLDKQLNSVEKTVAKMESEVAELADVTDTNKGNTVSEPAEKVAAAAPSIEPDSTPAATTQPETATTTDAVVATAETVKPAPVAKPAPAAKTAPATEVVASTGTAVVAKTGGHKVMPHRATAKQRAEAAKKQNQARQQQLAQENQARLAAAKNEQKQHMAELFARIQKLEAARLDQYKAGQDKQIERLRKQIATQQQMIEALIQRNQQLFEMRAATLKRQQAKREEILNRI